MLVLLTLAAGGAFLVGRATAPGPAVVVVPGAIAEQEPAVAPLPLVVPGAASPWPAIFTPAPGLADDATTASGYQLVTGGLDGAAVAAGIAAALGVPDEVREVNDGWVVGRTPGAALQLLDDPYLSWSLTHEAAAAPDEPPLAPERARELAADLLGGIGVDLASVDWQVDRYDDRMLVTAWQLVDDSRTGLGWTVGLAGTGSLVSASGFAAGLQEVPGYPVVGATTAVRRAALPTWATVGPTPLGNEVTPGDGADPTAQQPGASAPGATGPEGRPALAVPVSDVVVSAADLGLAQFRQPDGAVLLLPSYLLTGSDGRRWTLLAVTGDYVDFVDVPYPSPTPSDG